MKIDDKLFEQAIIAIISDAVIADRIEESLNNLLSLGQNDGEEWLSNHTGFCNAMYLLLKPEEFKDGTDVRLYEVYSNRTKDVKGSVISNPKDLATLIHNDAKQFLENHRNNK